MSARRWRTAALAALVAAVAYSATAAPTPDPAMQQLDYFVGAWDCSGRDAASAFGPEHAVQTHIDAARDLDGMWLAMHWQEQATAANVYPWKLENAFTYDSPAHEFVFLNRDNTGIAASGTSAGWRTDALVVAGSFGGDGKQLRFRDTYTKRGDQAFDFVTEIEAGGRWSTDAELHCSRAH